MKQKLNILLIFLLVVSSLTNAQIVNKLTKIEQTKPVILNYELKGSLTKKAHFEVSTDGDYANISLFANGKCLVDNLDIPAKGTHNLECLIQFPEKGNYKLKFVTKNNTVVVTSVDFKDFEGVQLPVFTDISAEAGLDRVNTIKYGGPCIADIDQDGDYDFVVTNHNDETNKLYWNNGDGTVKKHGKDISRWYMQDLHGVSCADFDNDGDLDIMQTKGGGNGKNPSLPDFYKNDNGKLVLYTLDAGITVGARGRGARWSDMDLDGDLDLMLLNAKGIQGETPQHNFYRNKGDGTFEIISVEGIENANAQRALVTDINGDQIDDFVLYDPFTTIWLGNGDFTFRNATDLLPAYFLALGKMMGATDIDIDNDGDLDLYFARGNAFGVGVKPAFDFCPVHMRMDIKIRDKGSFKLALEAEADIDLHEYDFVGRNGFKGNEFPIYLGKDKITTYLNKGDNMLISQTKAEGWPDDILGNGIYFGHVGGENWRSAVVINGDIFWNVNFSLLGVKNATPEFIRLNSNHNDVLLRNDGDKFTDISEEWKIPQGGNHAGVTTADFNNDGLNDLFVYRYGSLGSKPADYMLLNSGKGNFETFTAHNAYAENDEGHGDMGQAFDFNLDGKIDLLNGSDDYGMWYLYDNACAEKMNYALVKVGYSPKEKIDCFSAEVILETETKTYRKRVGSAGEIFSQSLLNIVHFGLGEEGKIKQITVKWRNGETTVISDKKANQLFDTDNVEPKTIKFSESVSDIRKGTFMEFSTQIEPINANKELIWSSSDENILKVDQNGKVTAVGKRGKTATISATAKSNGLKTSTKVKVVKNYKIPVKEIMLSHESATIYTEKEFALKANILPKLADNKTVKWESSNPKIATVNENGLVTGISEGTVETLAISEENNKISAKAIIKVKPYLKPGLEIVDSEKFTTKEYKIGDTLVMTVNYFAGSGNKVVSQDLGGVKFWFRQLNDRWMASGNYDMIVDKTALGKESGQATFKIKIRDLVPYNELPEKYVYYIFVGMASSNGNLYTKEFFPIKIVK